MKKMKLGAYLVPILLVFMVATGIYYSHYENTVDIIKSEYGAKIELIEQSIYNETKYTEIVSKIAERHIGTSMEENSKVIADYYEENPDVLEWDMEEMSRQLDHMDIYILDKNLSVVASSLEEEVGMNFNSYPDFSVKLKERLRGDKFESDTINFSLMGSELRKYGYIPTLDKAYLIELSVTIKDLYPELETLNVIYLSDDLKNKYDFIADINIYKYNRDSHSSRNLWGREANPYENITKDRNDYIRDALNVNEVQKHKNIDEQGHSYTIKYIPYIAHYEGGQLTWWRSYVTEIIYNDEIVLEDLSRQKKIFLQGIGIITILYFGFAFVIIYLLEKKHQAASEDHLTKLPNRKRFEEEMTYKMAAAHKRGTKIAVLFFDLDKFKEVNDTYGHNVGDKVLQEIAKKISSIIPPGDMVSRLGGDEFTALISGIRTQEEVMAIGETMSKLFTDKLKVGSKKIAIKPSIGISIYPDHGEIIEGLVLSADQAMYEAKEKQLKYKIYKAQ